MKKRKYAEIESKKKKKKNEKTKIKPYTVHSYNWIYLSNLILTSHHFYLTILNLFKTK